MADSHGYMVFAATVFAENNRDILFSGSVESDSIGNALIQFEENCERTQPGSIIAGWADGTNLPVRRIQVELSGVALQKDATIGKRIVEDGSTAH